MKNAFSYIASIIVSVLLVFCTIAAMGAGIAKVCVNEKQFKCISDKYDLDEKVYSELERYFKERSSASGIPADVYMDAIDTEYLGSIIDRTIDNGFHRLRGGISSTELENEALEESIDRFFNDYADSIGYQKDDKFEQKLKGTKSGAYKIIGEYCDVYKFGALGSHGVLGKLSQVYTRIDLIMVGAAAAILVLLVMLLLLNLDAKSEAVYWTGVSALIAGIIGIVPCVYLLATDYFSSFSIKQAQIYTAYTETMKLLTNTFLYTSIGVAALGAVLIIVYVIFKPKNKAQAAA